MIEARKAQIITAVAILASLSTTAGQSQTTGKAGYLDHNTSDMT
jgi:hypothetical protein